MPRRDPKTHRLILGRTCILAHVRGRDPKADEQWDIEKKRRDENESRLRTRPRGNALARKTSRSPVGTKISEQPPGQRLRRGSTVLTVEEVVKEMDSAVRQLFAAHKGKHTRKARGDRPETPFDRNLDAAERGLRDLGGMMLQKRPRPATRGRSARRPANPMPRSAFSEDIDPDEYPKEGTDEELGERAGAEEGDNEQPCVCGSVDYPLMVECHNSDCLKTFHLGCVGKGAHPKNQYELPNADDFHRKDAEAWHEGETKDFECPDCEKENSKKREGPNHFKRQGLLLETLNKLMAQRRTTLRRADSQEQVDVIETFFEKIQEEMDSCTSVRLSDWKAFLAKALLAPLPTPTARKRGAAEIEREEIGPGVDGGARSKARKVIGKATRSPSKTAINGRAGPSSRPFAGQVYREGGEMTLPMGPPKRVRGNSM